MLTSSPSPKWGRPNCRFLAVLAVLAVTVLWVQPVLAADDTTAAVTNLTTSTAHRSTVVDESMRSDSNQTIDTAGESSAPDPVGVGATSDKDGGSKVDSGISPVISDSKPTSPSTPTTSTTTTSTTAQPALAASSANATTTASHASGIHARRLTAAVDRDRKLMSVLAARQQEHGDRISQLRAECYRNCTSNFTTRGTAGCTSQCVQLYREDAAASGGTGSTSAATAGSSGGIALAVPQAATGALGAAMPSIGMRSRTAHRPFDGLRRHARPTASAIESNAVVRAAAGSAGDELLDTEESQSSGLYVTQPRERYATVSSSLTKDVANRNSSSSSNAISLSRISARNNVIENEWRQTSTEKVYAKFGNVPAASRISIDGRTKRVDAAITSKVRSSEASVEDSDLQPYQQFGDKLKLSSAAPQRRDQQQKQPQPPGTLLQQSPVAIPRRTPIGAMLINGRTLSKPGQEDDQSVASSTSDASVAKHVTSKLRHLNTAVPFRNIVTLTRKLGGNIEAIRNATAAATASAVATVSNIPSVTELRGGSANLTEARNDLEASSPQPEESSSTTLLLIHVPDPDPVTLQENEIISTSVSSLHTVSDVSVTTSNSKVTTTTTSLSPVSDSSTIDQGTSTATPPTSSTLSSTLPPPSTTMRTTTSTTTTTTPPPPPRPTVRMIPVHPISNPNPIIFLTPEPPRTTSTTTTTTAPPASSTPRTFTRTTVSSSVRSTVNSRFRPARYTTTSTSITPTVTTSTARPTNETSNSTLGEISQYFNNGQIPSIDTMQEILHVMNATRNASSGTTATVGNTDVTIEMHRMNMATYVLAGLGVFPIVAILLYLARTWVFRRPPKTDAELERYMSENQKKISPVVKFDAPKQQQQQQQHVQQLQQQQQQQAQSIYSEGSIMTEESFNRNLLKFKSLLGEGNFGQVWKAEADDLLGHMGTTRIVAVKTERCGMVNGGLQDEAAIMRKLGSHANVVTLLGACTVKEPHLLIMEFAMRGRLLSLLRAARSATCNDHRTTALSVDSVRLAPLSPRRLAGFAHDIARGMEYIADRKIVHRDLAARNVLLDHNGVCKICDFGMSIDLDRSLHLQPRRAEILRQQSSPETTNRFRFDFHRRSLNQNHHGGDAAKTANGDCKRPALPIRWMAPEALQYHIFSTETDVWAFGIVLWEIATLGCTPYPTLTGRQVVRNIPTGTRPEIPHDCRPELFDLMSRTWRKDPRLRPTFTEARLELSRALCQWEVGVDDASSDYLDISGFSEDLEQGMVYFNRRIPEFECEI